jgi:hypothetical protein
MDKERGEKQKAAAEKYLATCIDHKLQSVMRVKVLARSYFFLSSVLFCSFFLFLFLFISLIYLFIYYFFYFLIIFFSSCIVICHCENFVFLYRFVCLRISVAI